MKIVIDPGPTVLNRRLSRVITWSQGDPGPAAKVSFQLSIAGVYVANSALLASPMILPGNGVLNPLKCKAMSFEPCLAMTVWRGTKNGTFLSEAGATDLEIAAALWYTVTFPAGHGLAVWSFLPDGSFSDGDVHRIWQSATPDGGQDMTNLTYAGD